MNPDRLAALEEEREFLLRSLADLEREHAAGDVEPDDYATLRDGYTQRAAAVLRAIDEGRAELPVVRRPPAARRLLTIGGALAVAGLAAWLLTASLSDRRAGDTITGGFGLADQDVNSMLVQARRLQPTDPLAAIELYDRALAIEPDNVEALTYRGWSALFTAFQAEGQAREVLVASGAEFLGRATVVDPGYLDAQCFTAILRFRFQNDPIGAKEPYDRCRAGDLPSSVAGFVEALGASLDEALTTTSVP